MTTVTHNTGVPAAVSRYNNDNNNNTSNNDDEHGNNNKFVKIVLLLLNKKIKDRSDWVQTEIVWRK
jgi:hypothetical protein